MPIRSMEYTAQTLRKQVKKNPKDLMEVFLIVVFYGKNRWTKTYELSDLYVGIERIKLEAKKEGKVETLIKLLTRKFKVLSEEFIETVKQSSIERLEQLSEDIFDVQNEADVLCILSA